MTPLIELKDVSRAFTVKRKEVKAVDSVSLALQSGEIFCMVGESGCGKTTTGKMIAGLLAPTGGHILYKGKDITTLNPAEKKEFRLAVQMVHQDPYASLNPTHTIYDIITTPLYQHNFVRTEKEAHRRACELLEMVDLTPAEDLLFKYPHQLSGGQRQRVSVARAITVKPSLIVADEAVSMVDVSIRISILRMMTRLRDEMGMAFVLITHDLALAKYFAWDGRIGVMYLGRMVELSPAQLLVATPQHPYTQVLISSIPEADPEVTRNKKRIELRSMDVPSLLRLPGGCAFHPRCPYFLGEVCEIVVPELVTTPDGCAAACHLLRQPQRAPAGEEAKA
jgi:peptide/nickel transport system ATP-binding protein